MSCVSCIKKNGKVAGCQNNGGCLTGGCNKLNVFDWLSDIEMLSHSKTNIIEVRFKNERKEFYRNTLNLDIHIGDAIVVDVPNGHNIGFVSLQGELVKLQMKKKNVEDDEKIRSIYRKASEKDLEKYQSYLDKESSIIYRAREIIKELKLDMKLSDVEYQADGTKATFYYSSETRVDFRELLKSFSLEFDVKIDMRQIGLRQEAAKVGGIGSCGRELCCSTWLTDFKSVNAKAARYQNLSINPIKLSGQCGRLKCCLNYELDTYMDAFKNIPEVNEPLITEKGNIYLQKVDIFKGIMWFSYDNDTNWYPIEASKVKLYLEMNKKGDKIPSIEPENSTKIETVVKLEDDLEMLDKKYTNTNKKKKKKKKKKKPNQDGNNPI